MESTPSLTPPDSSTGFANEPLVNLLRLRKERPVMTQDELRLHVGTLRGLRTSGAALGRMLKQEAAIEDAKLAPVKRETVSTKDLYKELGL